MKQEIITALSSWSQFLEFHEKLIPTVIWSLIALSFIIIIIRFGLLFWYYINNGNIGDFEDDSGFISLFSTGLDFFFPTIFIGPHPGAILVDFMGFAIASMIIGIVWPALLIIMTTILPVILLARFLRKRIARKQEFIAKLDGTHVYTK